MRLLYFRQRFFAAFRHAKPKSWRIGAVIGHEIFMVLMTSSVTMQMEI
jgi:hypothetical protein